MSINPETGLFSDLPFYPSPNCDARPADADVSLLVIHSISLPCGEYGGPYVTDLFMNRLDCSAHPSFHDLEGLAVSAHLFVRRTGAVMQFVPLHLRAWHAGVSTWQGQSRCNDFSIGIELEGDDDHPFTPTQYSVLAQLCVEIQRCYPAIERESIVGHQTIAPDRKTDPGPYFEWSTLFSLMDTYQSAAQ